MKAYPINPFIDVYRLLCCKFRPGSSCCDPVICGPNRGLAARKTLFYFSSIKSESGQYDHPFSGYDPYISNQPVMLEYLPEAYGRDAFLHLMEARPRRIKAIVELLKANDINVRADDECWTAIGRWISTTIEPNRETGKGRFLFRPVWYSLLLDLSILLGEQIISVKPGNKWQFWADLPKEITGINSRSPLILGPDNRETGRSVCLPMDLVFSGASAALTNKINNNSMDGRWGRHLFLMALQGKK